MLIVYFQNMKFIDEERLLFQYGGIVEIDANDGMQLPHRRQLSHGFGL